MSTLILAQPVLAVECDKPLANSLYEALERLHLEVLGPTNDAIDVVLLARDRHPQLALLDNRIDGRSRRDLEVILSALGVPCMTFFAGCERFEAVFLVRDVGTKSASIV